MAKGFRMKKIRVLIYSPERIPFWRFPLWLVEEIRREFPSLEVEVNFGDRPLSELIGSAEVLVSGRLRREEFLMARRLRWVHSPFVGVGNMLFSEMVESPVVITNSRGVNAEAVATHAVSLSLALIRGLAWAFEKKKNRDYDHRFFTEAFLPREPQEVVAGVFGYGEIGRRVFRRLKALGFETVCLNSSGTRGCYPFSSLEDFLERIELLVISAPRTPQTQGCIDLRRMEILGGFVVNVGRGKIVVEEDLARALKEGHLKGAALDVFEREPLPKESPLWEIPNLIITPHIAGTSPLFWRREGELLKENLRRFLEGRPLLNRVDKRRGY